MSAAKAFSSRLFREGLSHISRKCPPIRLKLGTQGKKGGERKKEGSFLIEIESFKDLHPFRKWNHFKSFFFFAKLKIMRTSGFFMVCNECEEIN